MRVWRAPRRSLSKVGWCAPAAQSQPPGRGPPSAARPPGHSRTRGRATRRSCRWHQMFHEAPACRVRAGGGRAHRPRPHLGGWAGCGRRDARTTHAHAHARNRLPALQHVRGSVRPTLQPSQEGGREGKRSVFESFQKRERVRAEGGGCNALSTRAAGRTEQARPRSPAAPREILLTIYADDMRPRFRCQSKQNSLLQLDLSQKA